MTLDALHSETSVRLAEQDSILLNGVKLTSDNSQAAKILQHLNRLRQCFGSSLQFAVTSQNSFPTGCGIASSASGLAALTVATVAAIHDAATFEQLAAMDLPRSFLADLARQGSGSAGRSLLGGFVHWQAGDSPEAQTINALPESDWDLRDTVVIFSDREKPISSTEAHRSAWSSPLFSVRLAGLATKIEACKQAIANHRLSELGPVLEQEALEMHAVMMTSRPPACYFDQEVSDFLAALRHLRRKSGLEVYFTMDAGPNVHLIYEGKTEAALLAELQDLIPGKRLLSDRIGSGPTLWAES